jgi:geranylgeranyl pyrophosphate synthase
VVGLVAASGACEAALARAAGVAEEARQQLGPLARSPAGSTLAGLADYVVSRKL